MTTPLGTRAKCAVCGQEITFDRGHWFPTHTCVPAVPVGEPAGETLVSAYMAALSEVVMEPTPPAESPAALVAEIRTVMICRDCDEWHGCMTGDCPHDHKDQCIDALYNLVKEQGRTARESITKLNRLTAVWKAGVPYDG